MFGLDPLAAVTALSAMTTVVIGLVAFYGSATPQSAALRGRLEGLMSGTSVIDAGTPGALRQGAREGGIFASLAKGNISEKLALQLERADLTISPGEYIALRLILAAVGFMGPLVFIGGVMGLVVSLVAALVGYNVPKFYMNKRRQSRVAKLNTQLPEALMMIANSLKAGFGLQQALAASVDQVSHPLSTEFARTIHEMNIGSNAEEALLGLAERSGSYDLDIVVTAILVQRTVGGNLGEILDTVAETMRERIRIRGEIETLTAQQKLTGLVIGALPIGVGLLFMVISPGYMDPLFMTLIGKLMLGAAVALEVVGLLVIRRVLNIEV
jgi:tight adherence protein B